MSEFDKKISALTSGSDSQAADEYVIARGGANYKITGANIAAAATKLGTIATGVWQGTAIANAYIATGLDVTKLTTGATLPSNVLASSLTSVGTLSSLTVSGDLTVDTSTLKVVSSTNRVGINLSGAPDVTLHASVAGAGIQDVAWLNNGQAVGGDVGSRLVFTGTTSNNGLASIEGAFWGATTADGGYMAFRTRAVTSGALTTRMLLDPSGNLGLGVTPSAWGSAYKAFQFGTTGSLYGESGDAAVYLGCNVYIDTGYKYRTSDFASQYNQENGVHKWLTAASGTAGNAITFTQAMTLDASGNLGVGTASPAQRLDVAGSSVFGTHDGANFLNIERYSSSGEPVAIIRAGSIDRDVPVGLSIQTRISNGGAIDHTLFESSGKLKVLGIYSTTVGGTNRDVFVDDTGLLGYVSSIRAAKTNIVPLTETDWLLELAPVTFNYRKKDEDGAYTDESDGITEYGLIAEDTEPVNADLCFYDIVDGKPELRGINYSKLVVPMLKRIQMLEARLALLEAGA